MARQYYREDNGDGGLEFWSANEVLTGFSLITNVGELKELHAARYEKNRTDGVDYYNHFQAGLYLDIVSEVYTVIEVVTLEAYLKSLADEIKSGSWLTAQNTITGLALSGIFTQSMKDEINNDINTYISDNY